ncbi:MAG: nucleotidyltransferase domain-containing protein [SAR324 cluster bacterium]|nr:nucleotidyltransferase domain-containing protein [SAR324 cluster bacterium]
MGSHARGKARQNSDIDLVLLCTEYESYLQDLGWADDFGKPASVCLEDYGKLTSFRVFYEEGPEVEFGFAQLDWLALPLDVGTVGVLRNGFQIVYDRSGKYLALELEL